MILLGAAAGALDRPKDGVLAQAGPGGPACAVGELAQFVHHHAVRDRTGASACCQRILRQLFS
ncbi:hypothetical protein B446_34715 [Streptomyces collinus Tu 365]|uniref:Uncharacterized protein n=1 Tax=Streptomyces collinus (strain DSM 40733 / Tue 365) TaxID=1214242 RepID=S5VEV7_STRC3|nr:hypothetical protein B446_00575 [Streptomyces collinus Tu 365]AGS73739.1 hypothetical protein B446_34715 [Streptomyces collinus Tu 365]